MASTYTTSLKIQQIGAGEQSGYWGTTTNTNWSLIEQAVAGVQSIVMANSDYTMTNLNGVSDEARNAVLVVTGTNSAIRKIIAPQNQPKTYIISNQTTGGYAITIGAPTGSIVTIPNGVTAQVYTDGTNFYSSQTGSAGDFLVNGNFTASGNETIAGTLSVGGITTHTGAVALNGGGTSTTPTVGDNTTKIATTAFVTTAVTNATGSLGTMSTQNANNVNITGGTISGVTASLASPLAVSSGGTGTSSITANAVVLGNGTSAVQTVSPSTAGNLLVSNGTTWTSSTLAASGVKLGLGITGEVWNNLTGSKSFNTQYSNSRAYPIAVSASTTCSSGARITAYVDGSQVAYYGWQFNGCGAYGGTFIIVPPGKSYQLNSGEGVSNWVELY